MEYTTRTIKLETIRRSVELCSKSSIPAIKEKLIGRCGKWWGTARQTSQAMLKELEANEEIVIDDENVWTYLRWQKILKARELDYKKMEDIFNSQKQLHTSNLGHSSK